MPGQPLLSSGYAPQAKQRTQVRRVPPLPTCQRYNHRSTARKLSLRAVFMSRGGVRSDQITDKFVSGVPPRLTLDEMHRDD